MFRKATVLLLPAVLALGAGCKPENTYEPARHTYKANEVDFKYVLVDPFLGNKARVADIRRATVQGDLMKIDVEIANDDTWDGNINYQFEWFDNQGMNVPSPSSTWDTAHLGGKETISLVAIAPTPDCKDFRLKLKRNSRD